MDKQSSEQEMKDNQALLNRHDQCTQAKLEALSAEQLGLYLHEVEMIVSQLEEILPPRLPDAASKQHETMLAQAYVLQDQFTLEIVRRQLLNLHAEISMHGKDMVMPVVAALECIPDSPNE